MASFRALTASSSSSSSFFLVLLFLASGGLAPPQVRVRAQQPYGTAIGDCPNQHNASGLLGYFCGAGSAPSCPAFLTFNARPPYSSLASVAALLGADAAGLAAANGVAAAAALAEGTRVLVPATCACTATPEGRFYQRNATYVVRPGDTLLIIANNTFQGLSSCQALQAQGLRGAAPETLNASQPLPVPLRCACPSAAQAAAGERFLLSYLVAVFDDVSAVAARFGVDVETIVDANRLQPPYTIFPYTTLLVPVSAQPNVSRIQTPPSPPPPPPVVAPLPAKKSGGHVGVYIGVAAAAVAVAAIASAGAFLAVKTRRRAGELAMKDGKGKGNDTNTTSSGFTGGGDFSLSTSEAFSSLSVTGINSSLKVYTYAELRAATDDFSPDRHLGGSVYRAAFSGDAAAVEVVDRNVSTEVEIMRKINHLNLIRLIGLCHHHGRWYLVTEYAEHGALRDRLLAAGAGSAAPLTWAQRVQVALDVAEGLRYLHEYARPPCVHMDVSSGSVLLAGDGPRAKLRSFGAARAITGATAGAGAEEALFTMTSRIAGTRGYIAPEYLEHGVVSPRADVYSLGVVLLELLTGKDAEELVGDGVGDPFAALRELAEELDGGGDAVLERLEELLDPALPAGSCSQDVAVMMVRLIERCVRRDAAARPSTGEVARRLLKLSGVSAVSWRKSPESPRSSGSGKGLMY
ncbi:lysM domain receptor-like kinase 4 [Panicum miliaceum]|uniref:LysM domain receptor-like kinase 4 n=1 Tax=Panicum miliaceum TaxID=4540 RepID=A0A3L6Q285_PANMI|nr:lysM domain receptor-like kinase 4 [Panicum miliaceum]